MGNFNSCSVILNRPKISNSRAARVVLPGGEIRQFREPVKAAELMLESPNNFVVNACSLTIGRRFSALSADEELEFGNVYVMFPMRRRNTAVTAGDMAVLLMAANSAAKRISGGVVKVTPEEVSEAAPAEPTAAEEDDGDDVSGLDFPAGQLEVKYYRLACRSRKPSLETIMEEPVRSR